MSVLVAGGCGLSADRRPDPSETITILYPADERLLSPGTDDAPKFLMFLPLVDPGDIGTCEGATGALAERWEHSSDYRVWTIWLRQNVRWHDDTPVTADDIKFTVDLLNHPDVQNYNGDPVDSVVVLDEHTARIFLRRPDRWPLNGWTTFYPKHLLDTLPPKEFYEWEFWTRPVGNGPFRYVRHVPRTMIELEANPDFHAGAPRVRRVILKLVGAGGRSGVLDLRSGDADLTMLVSLTEARALAAEERFRALYGTSASHSRWLVYNPRVAALGDVRVRRALTMALDRAALHAGLGFPPGVPITDAPYTPCQFDQGALAPVLPVDHAAARALLAAAGWADADGDGMVERGGVPLRFTVLVGAREEAAGVLVQEQLRRVGVRVDVARLDAAVVRRRMGRGEFEAAIPQMVRVEDYLRDDSTLVAWYAELVALLHTLPGEPDIARLEAGYRRVQELFLRDRPATYLYPVVAPLVAHARIHGLDRHGRVAPYWRWPFGVLEAAWIEVPQ